MTAQVLVETSAYWIRTALRAPYELSFGTLNAFDVIVVRVVDNCGRVGYGESCPVPPYSAETAEEVWRRIKGILPEICESDAPTALEKLRKRAESRESFSYVAPSTAVEDLVEPPHVDGALCVPVVGAVLTHCLDEIPAEIQRLTDQGYRTLKVKVGFDPANDLANIRLIKSCMPDGVQLRLDANEAWDLAQASGFLNELDPTDIELLEQPFPRNRWDWVTALKQENHEVPLMLDESIHMEDSIERAAASGVDIVKLKLMKAGSRSALYRRMRLAQQLGLSVVIGNGVAGVVDNWHEAQCALATGRAGEMNGNLKIKDAVFDQRPSLESGQLRFPAGFALSAREDKLVRRSQQIMRHP